MHCGFVTCGPNEALVVSGCCHKKPLLIPGGRVFVWPLLQECHRITLNIMTLQVESPKVYTSQGVPISVTGIAQIKIQGQNEEMLSTACEQFLGKTEVEIANIALLTLEGHQRAIMGSMTVEEIYKDRKKFSANVFEVASSDLINMGITVVSYTLKDIRDDEGYLLALGMSRTAEVKRDARIGEAEAKRDALIKEAIAEEERMASRLFNDTEIAKAKRDYEVKKAAFEVEVQKKKAQADMAFELQTTKLKQKVMEEEMQIKVVERAQTIVLEEEELKRKLQELEANVKIPAVAEKYRLERLAEANRKRMILEAEGEAEAIHLKGEAEAFAIEAKAKAEANHMIKKAEAWNSYGEAAMIDMILEVLPKIAAEVAAPLSQTKKITMISTGTGSLGPAKLTNEVLSIVNKMPEVIKSLTGLDVAHNVESSRSYVDELYSSDMDKCLQAIICLKNSVIGSNRQKGAVIAQGVVPRLIQLLSDPSIPNQIKIHATVTLGSLAKGTDDHIKALVDLGVVPHLLNGLVSNDAKLIEYCLCCLRSIFQSTHAPVDLLYYDENLTSHLLSLALQSVSNQVCVTTVLATACKTAERQALLCSQGAVGTLAALLCSPHYKVQMPTLCCLANITFQNPVVSSVVATTSYGGKSIPELVVSLTGRSRATDVQLAAAKVLANLQRAGAIPANDTKILYRALPCLVWLCKEDCPPAQRVEAAETLAFLTEVDMELQRLASISNHLIPTLAGFLRGMPLAADHKLSQDMKQAAFRAFASLGANDEDIRKRIIDTDNLMQHVVAGLEEPSPGVQLAAVRCLHSLSRSVQQLRTTFQDHRVWQPLMQLLKGDDDILTVASSTLCNLLLEFSPSKEPILESGAIDLLCDLTRRPDPALRLNGIWALMNMAFQAEQKIKSQILASLGTDQIFRLLSDSEVSVLMKTLGLLRNLLSTKPHIDHIMSLHAIQIMQAVILILEGSHSAEVKEQALCILANIADGDSAKDYIMANEDVLKKLTDYMMHSNVKLQIAAVYCISNLVWREDAGASERQIRLKDMGVYKLLQQLIMTSDTALFDKVKTAMTQFSEA